MKTVKMKRTGLIKSVSDRNAKALVYIKVAEYYEQETKKVEQVPEPVYHEVSVSDQAKNLAEDNEVDLSLVVGSGKDGAILKRDVQAYIDERN